MSAFQSGYGRGKQRMHDVMMPYYSSALDEIYLLRKALLLEAKAIREALELKTFPKSQRLNLTQAADRMEALAQGVHPPFYDAVNVSTTDKLYEEVGGNRILTRDSWEKLVDSRKEPDNPVV